MKNCIVNYVAGLGSCYYTTGEWWRWLSGLRKKAVLYIYIGGKDLFIYF